MNDEWYERALGRIQRFIVVVGIIGTAAMLIIRGRQAAVGFLVGAAFSFVNFQLLCAFTKGPGGSSKGIALVLASLRYLLIGGAAYVIVRVLEIPPLAVLGGLLAALGAVILEILYELILHARA
jgi:ribose/xylose/arabinose/galactoside ABC-type transport system permease subunit